MNIWFRIWFMFGGYEDALSYRSSASGVASTEMKTILPKCS